MIERLLIVYRKMNMQARASAWFVLCSFFQKGIAFITVPIFTRLLTVEEYGVINLFTTWLTFFTILATLNLSGGCYNRGLIKYDKNDYTSSVQSLATVCTLIVCFFICIFYQWISEFTGLDIRLLYLICPYLIFVSGINFWSVKERFFFRYKKLVVITILNTLLSTCFGLIAIIISTVDRGTEKVFWSTVAMILVSIPFYVLNFRNGRTFYNKEMWLFSLNFNLPLLPHYLSNIILSQSDRVMINMFCGVADVAMYSIAFSIASITKIFTDAISATLVPWRYQLLEKKEYRHINKVSLIVLAFVGAMIGLINLFAPEVLFIFGDVKYREAVWCIPPLMLCTYFIFAYGMFSNVEFYFLKTKFMMVTSVSSAILNIVLNYLFVGTFGYIACAYTSLLCYIFYCFGHYIYMKHICNKEIPKINIYNMRWFMVITVTTGALTVISTALYNHSYMRYILIFIIMGLLFAFRKSLLNNAKVFMNLKKELAK